jgi:hypothetical protein
MWFRLHVTYSALTTLVKCFSRPSESAMPTLISLQPRSTKRSRSNTEYLIQTLLGVAEVVDVDAEDDEDHGAAWAF